MTSYEKRIRFFIIHLTHANVNEEALQLHAVNKKPYFLLQVTCTVSEHTMKSKVCMIKSLSP